MASKHEARKPQKLALKAGAPTSPTQLTKANKGSFAAAGDLCVDAACVVCLHQTVQGRCAPDACQSWRTHAWRLQTFATSQAAA